MRERLVTPAKIVKRLAQRELDVEAVVVLEVCAGERLLHRRDVVVGELDRLQIREAPPDFAQRRIERDRLAIGGDGFVLPADRLQHVAVAQSARAAGWARGEDLLVEFERLLEIAEPAERRRLEVQMAQIRSGSASKISSINSSASAGRPSRPSTIARLARAA